MDIDSLVECVLLRRQFKNAGKCIEIEAKDYELVKPANDPISYEIVIHDEVLCKCHISKSFMWDMDARFNMRATCRELMQHNLKILDSNVVRINNRFIYKYQIFWQNNFNKKIDLSKKMDLDYL